MDNKTIVLIALCCMFAMANTKAVNDPSTKGETDNEKLDDSASTLLGYGLYGALNSVHHDLNGLNGFQYNKLVNAHGLVNSHSLGYVNSHSLVNGLQHGSGHGSFNLPYGSYGHDYGYPSYGHNLGYGLGHNLNYGQNVGYTTYGHNYQSGVGHADHAGHGVHGVPIAQSLTHSITGFGGHNQLNGYYDTTGHFQTYNVNHGITGAYYGNNGH